jgi:tRNA (cmo5U34)-methyltransferase
MQKDKDTEGSANGRLAVVPGVADTTTASMISGDRLFADATQSTVDFSFDERTASVFDDMVSRSVPLYAEMQRMTGELATDFAVAGTNLYDLGCATGTTLFYLDQIVSPDVRFVGIDNAPEMLIKAQDKLSQTKSGRVCDLRTADLHGEPVVHNASVVIMILTLQFVRPLYRERIMQRIYDGMNDNAALILIEKVTFKNSLFNRLFIDHYYALKKRHGYSSTEIAKKREALENVLIPYHPEENLTLLSSSGFTQIEEFFRWYNFLGLVAVK